MGRPKSRFEPRPLPELVALVRDRSTPTESGCLVYGRATTKAGYGQVWDGFKNHYTHRVMCEDAHGPAPSSEYEALHSCDNPPCSAPEHLRWGLHDQNLKEMRQRGRARTGGQKLNAADVSVIRTRLSAGQHQDVVAAEFGVTQSAISRVHTQSTWKDIR